MKNNPLTEKYRNTYSGRKLFENYSPSDYGIWQVLGEDSNADFGGSHYRPTLGYFEGKLEDVVNYAVNIQRFWSWGAGGEITPIKIVEVNENTVAEAVRLEQERKRLEQERDRIDAQLKAMGVK